MLCAGLGITLTPSQDHIHLMGQRKGLMFSSAEPDFPYPWGWDVQVPEQMGSGLLQCGRDALMQVSMRGPCSS